MMWNERPMTELEDRRYNETLAGKLEDIERRVVATGDPGLLAMIDQGNAHLREIQRAAMTRIFSNCLPEVTE